MMAAFAFAHPRDLLTCDIIQKYESVKESNATTRKKKRWCEGLEQNIKQIYPNRKLILVGSSTTSFAIEGCDVDLALIRTESQTFYDFESGLQILSRIRGALNSRPSLNTELISSAVVPILKLKDRSEGLEGDISVDVQNAIFNTYLQKCYGTMDPRVPPLVTTIKYWAQVSGITGALYHKLSGFAIVLLVIYYLQRGCSPPVLPSLQKLNPTHFTTSSSASSTAEKLTSDSLPAVVTSYNSTNTATLGDLLVGFFSFYCDFDWHQVLSVRLAGPRRVPSDKKWTRPYIRIEDPFDQKNVTRAVYMFPQFSDIKRAFKTAKGKLAYGSCRLHEIL